MSGLYASITHQISIPEKSVLITIDDGAKGTGKHNGHKLIPLLEEYKMYPAGAVWDYYCNIKNVPVGDEWLETVKEYEKKELSKRN